MGEQRDDKRGACDVCGAAAGRCMTTTICQQEREERKTTPSHAPRIAAPCDGCSQARGCYAGTEPCQKTIPSTTRQTAKQQFAEVLVEDATPLERLRLFCSLAMNGQDWLDVEPFFDALETTASATRRSEPLAHDWQPDGGVLRFESHPGGEAPHVHTTCAKCGARAWFLEYQWELLSPGCARAVTACSADAKDAARYRWLREVQWPCVSGYGEDGRLLRVTLQENIKLGSDCPTLSRLDKEIDTAMNRADGGKQTP